MNNTRLSNYRKSSLWLIFIATALRLALAGFVELNNDEVYYWTYAQHFQWNYFDHPPMVGLCIRMFTGNLSLPYEFFIRLPGVISSACCTWLIFLIGRRLKDDYTGWLAAILFTASFYGSVIAGLLILPDSPQLAFWLWSVYLLLTLLEEDRPGRSVNRRLLWFGVTTGLCIFSKLHGVFLWAGFGAFILFHRRSLLKNPFLYLSACLTAGILAPTVLWSIHQHVSTYSYHSSRLDIFGQLQPDSFFRELFGSALYNNPVVYVLVWMALIGRIRKKITGQRDSFRLLAWLGLPLIGTVLFLSLFSDTLPHWSGPGYVTLLPLAAWWLNREPSKPAVAFPRVLRYALGLTVFGLFAALLLINYWPGSLGKKSLPDYGRGDITLDMYGWRDFRRQFEDLLDKDSGTLRAACVFTDYWFPGGHLNFYVTRPLHLELKVVGSLFDIHHFARLNERVPALPAGANAYYINISNFYNKPPEFLTRYFRTIGRPVVIPQKRSGVVVRYFYVYRLYGYKGGMPADGVVKE